MVARLSKTVKFHPTAFLTAQNYHFCCISESTGAIEIFQISKLEGIVTKIHAIRRKLLEVFNPFTTFRSLTQTWKNHLLFMAIQGLLIKACSTFWRSHFKSCLIKQLHSKQLKFPTDFSLSLPWIFDWLKQFVISFFQLTSSTSASYQVVDDFSLRDFNHTGIRTESSTPNTEGPKKFLPRWSTGKKRFVSIG